ncbi:hypothetical protein YC2023_077583 [Brassica napus]
MDVYALPVPGASGKTCAQIFEDARCVTHQPVVAVVPALVLVMANMLIPSQSIPGVCLENEEELPGRTGDTKKGRITWNSPYKAAVSALPCH